MWTTRHRHQRRRNRATSPRLRGLFVESLEPRALMAADTSPLVGIRLGIADPATLQPISATKVGQPFALVAYVRDLRATPQGVYSTYLDMNFPAAQFEVSGAVRHLGGFVNGESGSVGVGVIDEVGGFIDSLRPPGGAEQVLASVPMIARQAGSFTFTADPADEPVGHEVLLFGINDKVPTSQLQFTSLTIQVDPSDGTVAKLDAVDDEYFAQGANPVSLSVLGNDSSTNPSSMTIFQVNRTNTKGVAAVSTDRRSILYTPPADFTGIDTFTYSVVDSTAESDGATVTVHVENGQVVVGKKAQFLVGATDRTGRPISAVNSGDDFLLQVAVQDLRASGQGVFAAYTDLAFPSQLARVTGPLEFTGLFSNGPSGSTATAGEIDEAGAFTNRLTPSGEGAFLLFQVPMKALGAGQAVFQAGPADTIPDHQVLLFGDNSPLATTEISYGQLRLEIRPAVTVVDDSYTVPVGTNPIALNVLANDQATAITPLTITQIDTTGLRGTVSVATDGRSLTYTPAADSRGTEQFRYTAANANGNATAQVTIHRSPLSSSDDLVQIRLETTDAAGSPLTSIQAGDSFYVQAFVKDLRATGDTGVYAAYFDLLYDAARAAVVPATTNPRGFDVTFGPAFGNGQTGSGATPGIINEIGAFQSATAAPGSVEQLLFRTKFQTSPGVSVADQYSADEDTGVVFSVLANDQPNQGILSLRSDPADATPVSDVLLFHPEQAVPASQIRFTTTDLNIGGGSVAITEVTNSRRGGVVTIVNNGQAVRYEPPANYFGPDDFSYSLGGGVSTAVQVNVRGVNDVPAANDDRYVTSHQQPLNIAVARGVLANDVDVDRDALRTQLVQTTKQGVLQLNQDGSFSYTPRNGFFGIDTFTYRALDGSSSSAETTVSIEVTPPIVHIRLDATDALGQPVISIPSGESLTLTAYVQDTRDASRADRGIGAAYFDVLFDPNLTQPQADSTNGLGFAVQFGPSYQNVVTGDIQTPGVVNDIGGLQTTFSPLGRSEIKLFSMTFKTNGVHVANDQFQVTKSTDVNVLDVLKNELGATFPVEFRSRESGNSPQADIVLFEPAQAMHGGDIAFGSATVQVQNSSKLVIESVGGGSAGGTASIDAAGRGIRYTPVRNFLGTESFTYTVKDEFGNRATGTVSVEVVENWSNVLVKYDVNHDSFLTPIDALQIINNLNTVGSRSLSTLRQQGPLFDVSGDGFLAPIDALMVINELARRANGGAAEGESGLDSVAHDLALESILAPSLFQSPLTTNGPLANDSDELAEDGEESANESTSAPEGSSSVPMPYVLESPDNEPSTELEPTIALEEAIAALLADLS